MGKFRYGFSDRASRRNARENRQITSFFRPGASSSNDVIAGARRELGDDLELRRVRTEASAVEGTVTEDTAVPKNVGSSGKKKPANPEPRSPGPLANDAVRRKDGGYHDGVIPPPPVPLSTKGFRPAVQSALASEPGDVFTPEQRDEGRRRLATPDPARDGQNLRLGETGITSAHTPHTIPVQADEGLVEGPMGLRRIYTPEPSRGALGYVTDRSGSHSSPSPNRHGEQGKFRRRVRKFWAPMKKVLRFRSDSSESSLEKVKEQENLPVKNPLEIDTGIKFSPKKFATADGEQPRKQPEHDDVAEKRRKTAGEFSSGISAVPYSISGRSRRSPDFEDRSLDSFSERDLSPTPDSPTTPLRGRPLAEVLAERGAQMAKDRARLAEAKRAARRRAEEKVEAEKAEAGTTVPEANLRELDDSSISVLPSTSGIRLDHVLPEIRMSSISGFGDQVMVGLAKTALRHDEQVLADLVETASRSTLSARQRKSVSFVLPEVRMSSASGFGEETMADLAATISQSTSNFPFADVTFNIDPAVWLIDRDELPDVAGTSGPVLMTSAQQFDLPTVPEVYDDFVYDRPSSPEAPAEAPAENPDVPDEDRSFLENWLRYTAQAKTPKGQAGPEVPEVRNTDAADDDSESDLESLMDVFQEAGDDEDLLAMYRPPEDDIAVSDEELEDSELVESEFESEPEFKDLSGHVLSDEFALDAVLNPPPVQGAWWNVPEPDYDTGDVRKDRFSLRVLRGFQGASNFVDKADAGLRKEAMYGPFWVLYRRVPPERLAALFLAWVPDHVKEVYGSPSIQSASFDDELRSIAGPAHKFKGGPGVYRGLMGDSHAYTGSTRQPLPTRMRQHNDKIDRRKDDLHFRTSV